MSVHIAEPKWGRWIKILKMKVHIEKNTLEEYRKRINKKEKRFNSKKIKINEGKDFVYK